MSQVDGPGRPNRRGLLRMGGGAVAGAAVLSGTPLLTGVAAAGDAPDAHGGARHDDHRHAPPLPVHEIESIVRAEGTFEHGVLLIDIDREDLPNVTKRGVPIKPSFEINGTLAFQMLRDGSAMLNADLAFKEEELNPAIDQMIAHGLAFQASHQHLFGLEPMVWFQHFRGRGTPQALARACAAILSVTSTPLPQAPPENPTTPLDVDRLSGIIGVEGEVGEEGVVTFLVPPTRPIILDGVRINPFLNVYSQIEFEPLSSTRAVVVPDFAQTAEDVNRLAPLMRAQGWEIDCLYNQESAEFPQLYFSHDFKVGDPYQLAAEVRRGLDVTIARPR